MELKQALYLYFSQLASRAGEMEKLPALIEMYQLEIKNVLNNITVTALKFLTSQLGGSFFF